MRRSFVVAAITVLALWPASPGGAQCLRFVEDEIDGANGQALDGAIGVAVTPDGRTLYVSSRFEDAINAFSIDPETRALELLDVERDGVAGVDGLDGADGVAVSPDGRHLYVTGSNEASVAAFAIGADGRLSFLEAEKQGVGGTTDMLAAGNVAVSPDGKQVYVVAHDSDAIVTFTRTPASGLLAFQDSFQDGDHPSAGIDFAYRVDVAPDGTQVFVTGTLEDAVSVFARHPTTGALTLSGTLRATAGVDGIQSPADVAVSPDGRSVYVSSGEGKLAMLSRDPGDGSLVSLGVVENGVGGVTGLSAPRGIAIAPDGSRVWVANDLDSTLVTFARDVETGALAFVEVRSDGAAPEDRLLGAAFPAVAPDGRALYVTAFHDDAVNAYEWPAILRVADVERDGEGGVEGLGGPAFVVASPDQRYVYAAGFGEDAIAVFARDAATGALDFVEFERNGIGGVTSLDGPSGLALSPDGKQLYVTGLFSDSVATFTRNASTGALAFASVLRDGFGGVSGIDGAGAILVSPDGDHVYVGGYGSNSLAIFSRHPTTGALTFVDALFDGIDAEALVNAGGAQMAMDALGEHLYVPASGENALSVFERDPATGLLDEVLVLRDDVDAPLLANAFNALLAPDDSLLYVTGFLDDAITSFVRDPGFGVLDVLEYEHNGVDGLVALEQPRGLAVSEKGDMLVAAAQLSDSVVAFDHDLAFGSTTFAGVATSGVCGYADLDSPSAVAAAGNHFYVTASNSNALVVLTPEPARALASSAALAILGLLARRRRS